jgi:hypothetical protein
VRVSRRTTHIAAAIVLAALLISVATPAPAAPRRRVIVLLAPYLAWNDVLSMPNARALAADSLLADVNVRAGGATGSSTPDRGALVISAGAPLDYADGALAAYSASETVGTMSARDLYLQYFGVAAGGSEILFAGRPRQSLANAGSNAATVIGALGSAVHAAGARTAAIGNADLGLWADAPRSSRPAGEAAADESGTADVGDVSARMLSADPASPFGVRANVEAILAQYRRAMSDPGVGVVIVDPGDLARANAVVPVVTSTAATAMRARALATTDEVLGGLVAGADPGDAVLLITQAVVPSADSPAGYGPAIIHDGTGAGLGASASTHRDGVVTVMDVSVTIVGLLGGTAPESMIGSGVHAATAMAGASVQERVAFLERLDATSVAVESIRFDVVNVFIVVAVIVLLGATIVLYRGRDRLPAWSPAAARVALLVPMAALLGALLQYALLRWPASGAEVIAAFVVATALSLAVALSLLRGRPATVPLIVLAGATTVTILVDQWLGAPLSLAGLFGYSPLLGARYYGLGNEMAGLLFGSAAVAFALVLDTWPGARWARALRTWGWPLLGAVVIATAAAPMWGANVGPAVWMTVGFVVGWMMLHGKRVLTWRNLVIVLLLIVVVVAGLSAIDLLGGANTRTHLGRALAGAESGGISTLWTIAVRKAETNMRILGRTNWTWLLVALLFMLGYLRWRPRGGFAAMLKRYPAFSVGIAAALFAGTVAYFTEDSGIIIPALMFIPVGVTALYLMLLPAAPAKDDDS